MDTENQTPPQETQFYRTIKTFVLRAGRMTPTQQKDYQELSGRWCIPYSDGQLNYAQIFNNTKTLQDPLLSLKKKRKEEGAGGLPW